MKPVRFALGLLALGCAVWLGAYLSGERSRIADMTPLPAVQARDTMPSLDGAVEWLNTKPLGDADLRGKVVLVDFWTYSCINWLRTLPHVRAWADKYRHQGLVVVGVHSPEFGFEKDLANVRAATARLQVDYPVAVDSRHTIWRAFGNSAWPAIYILDARGRLRHTHLGEGGFEKTERVLQELLAEAGAGTVDRTLVQVQGSGSQAQADWASLRSPETYTGHARTHNFASPGGIARDRVRDYSAPAALRLNAWALSGPWRVGGEAASLHAANGRIVYRFQARDVHLVMGPASRGQPVPFRVLVDGKPPGESHGADVDAHGMGTVVEHRLYQLVRQPGRIEPREFEIEFLAPGVEAFSFTFG